VALAAEKKKLQDLLRRKSDLQMHLKSYDTSGLAPQIDQDNKRLKDLDLRMKEEQKSVKLSQQDRQAAIKATKAQQAEDNRQMRDALNNQKKLVQELNKQYQAVNRNRFDFNRTTKMNDLQQQIATQQATLTQMQSDFDRAEINQRAELENIQNASSSEAQDLNANTGQTQAQRDAVVADLKRLNDVGNKLKIDRSGLETSLRDLDTAITIEQQKVQSIQDQLKTSSTNPL
jgi:chromosome segregation ATPase